MPRPGKPHEWHAYYIMYESHERCARCGVRNDTNAPRHCITDAELADREEWRAHAEIAAHRMLGRAQ